MRRYARNCLHVAPCAAYTRLTMSDSPEETVATKDLATTARGGAHVSTYDVIDKARFEDIARRVLMQQSRTEIARAHDVTPRHLRRILVEPEFLETFEKARKALFDDIDKVIADEKTAPLIRARAQMIRSQTVIGEVLEEVRTRIKGGRAKAADMRVAINAAFGTIDRSKGELGSDRGSSGGGGTHVNVLNVSASAKEILRNAIGESGIDLTDVMPVTLDITPEKVEKGDETDGA